MSFLINWFPCEILPFQIGSLTQCPFSVIAKAGKVVDVEHLEETLPVVWELLLDDDQQLVSSVGKMVGVYQSLDFP